MYLTTSTLLAFFQWSLFLCSVSFGCLIKAPRIYAVPLLWQMVLCFLFAGSVLQSDCTRHVTFQRCASPVTRLQWATGNCFGQPVDHPRGPEMWYRMDSQMSDMVTCRSLMHQTKMWPMKYQPICAELSLHLLYLVSMLFQTWADTETQTTEPFITQHRRPVKRFRMLQSNFWKHYTHRALLCLKYFKLQ